MPRVTSTSRSLSHCSSGSRQGRSRKSGFPGRTSIWKRGASLTLRCPLAAWESVAGDDLDASRARRRMSRHVRDLRPSGSHDVPTGRLDMTPTADHSPLAARLSAALEPLERLTRNLAWTWDGEMAAVLR